MSDEIYKELQGYLNRPEMCMLTVWHKKLLYRFCRRYYIEDGYPIGRILALACSQLNSRYKKGYRPISQAFISWLYYY